MVSYQVLFVHFFCLIMRWGIFMTLRDAIGREVLSENAKKGELHFTLLIFT